MRQFRRLSDPRDQDDLVLRLPRPLQRFFHRVQDRDVPAPGPPGVLHVRVEDSAHRPSFTPRARGTGPPVAGGPRRRRLPRPTGPPAPRRSPPSSSRTRSAGPPRPGGPRGAAGASPSPAPPPSASASPPSPPGPRAPPA